MEKPKQNQNQKSNAKNKPAKTATPAAPVAPVIVPPMFRRFDWLALAIAFIGVWAVYLLTLAPE